MLILGSGLMLTLAFLKAKDSGTKNHHGILLSHLCRWLGRTLEDAPLDDKTRFPKEGTADFKNVLEALNRAPSSLYMRATDEALALLRWIRQFADARKAMEGK